MLPKIVVVLSCLCVVRAAVITVNAFDDENEINPLLTENVDVETNRLCISELCKMKCIKMGFSNGSCIKGRCQCDKPPSSSPVLNELLNLEINPLLTENVDVETNRLCISELCKMKCIKMGFSKGSCIKGRCQCDKPPSSSPVLNELLNLEINPLLTENVDVETNGLCISELCKMKCIKMGFSNGSCIKGRCQCDKPPSSSPVLNELLNLESNDVSEDDKDQSIEDRGSCTPSRCNQVCRRLGYPGGVCVRPNVCQCRSRSGETADYILDTSEINNVNEDSADQSPEDRASTDQSPEDRGSCTSSRCNQVCRRLGYPGGVCVRPNVCQCRSRSGETADYILDASEINNANEDSIDQSLVDRASCTPSRCNQICRQLGYSGGVCIRPNVCQCNARAGRSAIDNSETSEIAIVRTVRSCAPAECNSFCIKMGYPRGVCIGTYCQCRMRSAAAADIPTPSVSAALEAELGALEDSNILRDCNLRWCEQNCRRLGFKGGACVNGRCKCDTLRSPSNPLLDSGTLEDTNILRDCNLRWCEQNCRRLGFKGGACVNGRCKCDILRSPSNPLLDFANNDSSNSEPIHKSEEIGNDGENNNIPEFN